MVGAVRREIRRNTPAKTPPAKTPHLPGNCVSPKGDFNDSYQVFSLHYLFMGENDHIDGVTLTKKEDDTVYVRTCREYDSALERDYYPSSNFDVKMSFFFKHPCGLLNALEKASAPQKSFISDAKVGVVNLELLPFEMFRENLAPKSSWDADRDLETTYQQKIDNQELVVTEKSQNVVNVEGFGMGQMLKEMVRADFNNDGIEDVLLFEYHHVTKGTYADGGLSS